MATSKKTETKVTEKKTEVLKKIRIDDREKEWLDSFKKAGYEVHIDKKHLNLTIIGTGVQIALQKNSIVPYIRFTSEEQLKGLKEIFSEKRYGYEIHMPAKKSDNGDKRFRAVGHRAEDEVKTAIEIVNKVAELKKKTAPKKEEEKKPTEKKVVKKPAKSTTKKTGVTKATTKETA